MHQLHKAVVTDQTQVYYPKSSGGLQCANKYLEGKVKTRTGPACWDKIRGCQRSVMKGNADEHMIDIVRCVAEQEEVSCTRDDEF